jgi:hypothetical protein
MPTILVAAILLAVLAGATVWSVWVWTSVGNVAISGHGYAAIVLMIVVTLAVGCGLMALVFYSSRKGYDEPPQSDE